MGRITRLLGQPRALVGLIGLGAFAFAACVPIKPPPPSDTPELPRLCVPLRAMEAAVIEPAPADPVCVPVCLPGEEPAPQPPVARVEPTVPDCIPLCPIFGDDRRAPPEAALVPGERCFELPIPCLPGQDAPREVVERAIRDCVNFCLPGDEGAPEAKVEAQLLEPCVPLCRLNEIFEPDLPGLEPCPPTER